ncbi:MAG: AAA family ATPase [Methylobacter sp.]|nr:AAA family ATPase [Methylobacter sp.]
MRILAIRGKNLASLAEPFEILLNDGPLASAGLFAITGHTGAGKSTILDALCLALYDEIPRLPSGQGFAVGHKDEDENLRVTSNDVRSVLRRGTANGYAEVDFIGKDKQHYRARWEVSKARGKADGRLQKQEVTLLKIDDGQRIGQGKKDTLELICDLIDLNFDQFRRSVLLAQGDFAAFLKAKKDERSSLLERITGTELYSELSIAAFERARQEKDALNLIADKMQHQIPLDAEARLLLEQLRDQLTRQLAELDLNLAGNQKIIDWYAELKKRQQAEQSARDALAASQRAWDAAASERQLSHQVEAAQPLRPLLNQYQGADAEHKEAQQKLKTSSDSYLTATTALDTAKTQLTTLTATLADAERQQQQAQALLIKARALDTRLDVIGQSVGILSREENELLKVRDSAEQQQQALIKQHQEHTATLQQLAIWLEQHQALKPIAAEWSRWDAELERHQALNKQKTAAELTAQHLTEAVANDERNLHALKQALDDSRSKSELQQQTLAQLKTQDSQQSLESLHQTKDEIETRRGQINSALNLAAQAHDLQQAIQQQSADLASTEQTLEQQAKLLHTVNQDQLNNSAALDEAKKALALIQATAHKNAEQFRALLQPEQPCPVCGALEHPWKDHVNLSDDYAETQAARVAELENQHEALIKTAVELTSAITQGQQHKTVYSGKLAEAEQKLVQCGNDWQALALHDAADFAVTDASLLPLLKQLELQINESLALLKQQEKSALALQKQLKSAQALVDAAKLEQDKLAAEHTALDKQLAKNKAEREHLAADIQALTVQLNSIVDCLATPFQPLANWQQNLHHLGAAFRQNCAAQVQQFQYSEQQLDSAAKALEQISHDEKLAGLAFEQCRQLHQAKQSELNKQTAEQQKLSGERDAVLPGLSADHYEQALNQKVQDARSAQQQAGNAVNQAETTLATEQQNQQHWHSETERRHGNLEKASSALNQALDKQAITREQLSGLLGKDEHWLAQQKTATATLERALQEAAALLKVKIEDCAQHQNQPIDLSEEEAQKRALELQQQRQTAHSQKEEQLIRLREDDKKIDSGRALKAELDSQQQRWEQWESINDLIGSRSGAKFRTFAQSLTLEALLAHSNRHLDDFAKRYVLQRVPGSDLELQIIDRDMADDVRSVHSLSGGESFLVSLALALGLASLSSNKTQVESLFIDEGFGSLDPETLDIAIASLDTLQALGRKVGVISHVPILVERIGARVVVEKQGGGRSRVVIAG